MLYLMVRLLINGTQAGVFACGKWVFPLRLWHEKAANNNKLSRLYTMAFIGITVVLVMLSVAQRVDL